MPQIDPNYARHLQYEASKKAKRSRTYEEEIVSRHNKHAIAEISRLTALRNKRQQQDALAKEETLLADAADHFIKRIADNQADANKQMQKILHYHGVDR